MKNKASKIIEEFHDSELKEMKKLPTNKIRMTLKAKDKISNSALVSALRTRNFPELQEHRLLFAVKTNNTERVQNLLEKGVNPNSTDVQSRSALHLATSRNYTAIVNLLLYHGANPNKQDIIGNTPLHLAACTNNLQTIVLLLDAGADVHSFDKHGRNPLQLAKSKLQILQQCWRSGTIEMIELRAQLQQIIDMMISLGKRKDSTFHWKSKTDHIDFQLMKLSIDSGPTEQVDSQMFKIQSELENFTIK